jgi:hypothetical protein
MWNGPIPGIVSLISMAITGKQSGNRKLHWVYRIMIVFIFAAILGSYLLVRFSK